MSVEVQVCLRESTFPVGTSRYLRIDGGSQMKFAAFPRVGDYLALDFKGKRKETRVTDVVHVAEGRNSWAMVIVEKTDFPPAIMSAFEATETYPE